jgi:hypothetical protein
MQNFVYFKNAIWINLISSFSTKNLKMFLTDLKITYLQYPGTDLQHTKHFHETQSISTLQQIKQNRKPRKGNAVAQVVQVARSGSLHIAYLPSNPIHNRDK